MFRKQRVAESAKKLLRVKYRRLTFPRENQVGHSKLPAYMNGRHFPRHIHALASYLVVETNTDEGTNLNKHMH